MRGNELRSIKQALLCNGAPIHLLVFFPFESMSFGFEEPLAT
jgi:hypothetical protein